MQPPGRPVLFGRRRELRAVESRLELARGGSGGATLFVGEPGLGKSALLRAARLRADGFIILSCRGVESEMELPFSGLHELLEPVLGLIDGLPRPQHDALAGALGLVDRAASGGLLSAYAGVLGLLTAASERSPILLVIDDLHWVDAVSADAVSFVARRLSRLPVAALMASRPRDSLPSFDEPPVMLDPLGAEDVEELATARRGRRLAPSVAGQLVIATGGNPLAVVETVARLGEDLDRRGTLLDDPPPVGDLIERGFAHRLEFSSDATKMALEIAAVSVLSGLGTLTAACRELRVDPAGIDHAEAAGTLLLEDGAFRFCHPLLRALVFRRMPADRRRACHRALAVATNDDAALHAWHVACAQLEPDEAVAAALAETATDFERRGGTVAAAKALERAAHLTPDRDTRAARLFRAARAARVAARGAWADRLLAQSKAVGGDERTQVHVEFEQIMLDAYVHGATDTPARFLDLAGRASRLDADLSVSTLSAVASDAIVAGDMPLARESIDRLRTIHPVDQLHPDLVVAIDETVGVVLVLGGDPAEVPEAERRLLNAAERTMHGGGFNYAPLAEALIWIEKHDLAHRLIRRLVQESRERGEILSLIGGLWVDGYFRFQTGDWAAARVALEESIRLARSTGQRAQRGYSEGTLAVVLGAQGDERAQVLADRADETCPQHGQPVIVQYTATARGLLALGQRDGAAAVEHFERAAEWARRSAQVEPCVLSWPADLVDAHLAAGNEAAARSALASLRLRAEATRRPWALASVARLEASLAAGADVEPSFLRALKLFERTRAPFDRARTQLAFGQALRRSGRRTEARTQFRTAVTEFDRLGAAVWAQRAREELTATGERVLAPADRDASSLTPQELVVAELVAGGASNKEVAAAMFLSTKTVESHLRHIYRKVGVRSRTQLAAHVHRTGLVAGG